MASALECTICLKDFDDGDHLPKVLRCGHTFCLACLLAIAREKSACPICRQHFPTHPHELETNYQLLLGPGDGAACSPAVQEQDPRKVFVCRIPDFATEEDLRALLSPFGEVTEVSLMRKLQSGESVRISALVTFQDERAAELALAESIEYAGCRLLVRPALPTGNAVVNNSQAGGWTPPGWPFSHRVFVHKVPHALREEDVRSAFSEFGAVQSVVLKRRRDRDLRGNDNRCAFVTFAYPEAVEKACPKPRPYHDKELAVPPSWHHQRSYTLRYRRLLECRPPRGDLQGGRPAGRAPQAAGPGRGLALPTPSGGGSRSPRGQAAGHDRPTAHIMTRPANDCCTLL